MKYNKNTHFLRPLEPGEIIEAGDIWFNYYNENCVETSESVGKAFAPKFQCPLFRPVPIPASGWRPRSEAQLLKALPPKSQVLWRHSGSMFGDALFDASVETGEDWTAFLVIPPCDLPQPDPERERFASVINGTGLELSPSEIDKLYEAIKEFTRSHHQ